MSTPDLRSNISVLVSAMRNPQADPAQTIRYFVYMLPLIKNPLNLRLLVGELKSCAHMLNSVTNTSTLVDGIVAAAQRKTKISNPTVPFNEWSQTLLEAAASSDPLTAVAVASGLLLAKVPQKEYAERIILHYVDALVENPSTVELVVACLVRAHWNLSPDSIAALPHAKILATATKLVYSPESLFQHLSGPIFADLGAYSHLMASNLRSAPAPEILDFLETVDGFVRTAVAQYIPGASTSPYKTLLFGVALQLKGLCVQVLHNRQLPARLIAQRILTLLQPLGFVIDEVGGSFEALSFVTSVGLDVLFEALVRPGILRNGIVQNPLPHQVKLERTNRASLVIAELGNNWHAKDPFSLTDRGALLYFLETAEKLLPVAGRDAIEGVLMPAAKFYIRPTSQPDTTRSIFEAAHSVMLAYLEQATSPLAREQAPEDADNATLEYFERVMELYPDLLTYTQFKLALDSIVAAAAHPLKKSVGVAVAVLQTLYDTAKTIQPGIALPDEPKGDDPPTLRAAYVKALLRALPVLCDPQTFAQWLDRLDSMVPAEYSTMAGIERAYLKKAIADTVTGLDLSLADIGIRYWFTRGASL